MAGAETSIDIVRLRTWNHRSTKSGMSPDTSQLYQWLPVSSAERTIRVLDLDQLSEDSAPDDTPLTGKLRVVSLDSAAGFAALSYVWGDYSQPTPDILSIGLENSEPVHLDITVNCRDALRSFRRQYGSIPIWIDAICINQSDVHEKESQILLMGDIYTWSQVVYVWLGYHTEGSKKFFEWLRNASVYSTYASFLELGETTRINEEFFAGVRILRERLKCLFYKLCMQEKAIITFYLRFPAFFLRRLFFGGPDSESFRAFCRKKSIMSSCWFSMRTGVWLTRADLAREGLEDILKHPWFTRGWTFQELLLPSNIIFLRGCDSITWDTLLRGLFFIRNIFPVFYPKREEPRESGESGESGE